MKTLLLLLRSLLATTKMKYYAHFLCLIFGLLFHLDCWAKQDVIFTDPSKAIIVTKSSPSFTITVQSNPTTGYSWFLKGYTTNLLVPVENKFYPPQQTGSDKLVVGIPGYEEWTFRAKPEAFVVPQLASVTLIYLRPWDEQSSHITNFKVIVKNDG